MLATALPDTDTIERRVVSEAAMKAPGKQTMTRPRRASLSRRSGRCARPASWVRSARRNRRAVVREELRRLLRRPVLLVLPLAVAGLAYGLLGFNAGLVDTVQGHDPYGAGLLASVRADGLNLYTSGFACGQLLSLSSAPAWLRWTAARSVSCVPSC